MTLIKQKSGATLLTVLVFATFLVFAISSSVILVSRQLRMQKQATDYQQAYVEAVNTIETTYRVLGSFLSSGDIDLTDSFWVEYQVTYGVDITRLDGSFHIQKGFSKEILVGELIFELNEEPYSPLETFLTTRDQIESPTFRMFRALDSYVDQYFFDEQLPETRTFDQSFALLRDQREVQLSGGTINQNRFITQNTYYSGSVTLNNNEYVVAKGKYVVINGDLTINNNQFQKLSGTFIIKGNLIVNRNANGMVIDGLYFIQNNMTAQNNARFGEEDALFIAFLGGNFQANNNMGLYGFVFAEGSISINSKRDPYVGGVFSYTGTPNAPVPDRLDIDVSELIDIGASFLINEDGAIGDDTLVFKKPTIKN